MKVVENTCPSCGAQLKMDRLNRKAHCDYCGGDFTLEEVMNESEIRHEETQKRQEIVRERQAASNDDTNYGIAAIMMVLDSILGAAKRIVFTAFVLVLLIIIAVLLVRFV